eukprot:2884106-Ditylum_brightwellii.AAC.1
MGSCKWILEIIKLNNYLVNFLVSEGVTATKWKLEFEKEGFNLSSVTFKEFLDTFVHLEEVEMHKPLAKEIACAKK